MKILLRYWRIIRRLRLAHIAHNIWHYRYLLSNKEKYRQAGLSKSIFSPISHKDFKNSTPGKSPWLDQSDAKELLGKDPTLKTFSPVYQEQLLKWPDQGYMILRGFLPAEKVDRINSEVADLVEKNKAIPHYTGSRLMDLYKQSGEINSVFTDPKLRGLLSFVLGKETVPFQTISFLKPSQQRTHSDSIHMTTEPLGYLIAVWIALEKITMENGPLHYYPGSHKLPYVMSEDFQNGNTMFTVGEDYYKNYEDHIARMIEEKNLEKKVFTAEKGDMLIWHSNLLHGGNKATDPALTRKSLVIHYFCNDVINYHEITQRPAIIKTA